MKYRATAAWFSTFLLKAGISLSREPQQRWSRRALHCRRDRNELGVRDSALADGSRQFGGEYLEQGAMLIGERFKRSRIDGDDAHKLVVHAQDRAQAGLGRRRQ